MDIPAASSADDLAELAEILNGSEMFQELARQIIEDVEREPYRKLHTYFPDTGALRRELYPKHLEFFARGATRNERAMIAANRVGKTTAAACELTYHLTGLYPHWWTGRRFNRPIVAWACGTDAKTVRDTAQTILFGPPNALGTGTVPLESMDGEPRPRAGVPDGFDSASIRHKSGGKSRLVLKAYDQGREAFQGAKVDVVWFDEESDLPVYVEALARTLSTVPGEPNGSMMCTFTPMLGLSAVVQLYMPGGKVVTDPAFKRAVTTISWSDVPHISKEAQAELLEAIPIHQRDARSKGIPQLGAGAIYPVAEESIVVAPFALPGWYRCCYALDVGWNRTAALWGALDPEDDILYLYSEHYMGESLPSVHAGSILARGRWIPGVIDPAARGRGSNDGVRLYEEYVSLGLTTLTPANNAVEAGLHAVWQRLATGRLKVFSTLQNWLGEFRVYRRNEKGAVVKENDHLMDCTRYMINSGLVRAAQRPPETWDIKKKHGHQFEYNPMAQQWGGAA